VLLNAGILGPGSALHAACVCSGFGSMLTYGSRSGRLERDPARTGKKAGDTASSTGSVEVTSKPVPDLAPPHLREQLKEEPVASAQVASAHPSASSSQARPISDDEKRSLHLGQLVPLVQLHDGLEQQAQKAQAQKQLFVPPPAQLPLSLGHPDRLIEVLQAARRAHLKRHKAQAAAKKSSRGAPGSGAKEPTRSEATAVQGRSYEMCPEAPDSLLEPELVTPADAGSGASTMTGGWMHDSHSAGSQQWHTCQDDPPTDDSNDDANDFASDCVAEATAASGRRAVLAWATMGSTLTKPRPAGRPCRECSCTVPC
jgi:hypothetical protein